MLRVREAESGVQDANVSWRKAWVPARGLPRGPQGRSAWRRSRGRRPQAPLGPPSSPGRAATRRGVRVRVRTCLNETRHRERAN